MSKAKIGGSCMNMGHSSLATGASVGVSVGGSVGGSLALPSYGVAYLCTGDNPMRHSLAHIEGTDEYKAAMIQKEKDKRIEREKKAAERRFEDA